MAIEFRPHYHEAWKNKRMALQSLGRSEEAGKKHDAQRMGKNRKNRGK